jgi:hypothetical protein
MDSHIVGNPTPSPSPNAGGAPEFGGGNSIAVVQFVELIRGERTRQEPVSRGVVEMFCLDGYCLGCCGVHPIDFAKNGSGRVLWMRCRFCGKESAG